MRFSFVTETLVFAWMDSNGISLTSAPVPLSIDLTGSLGIFVMLVMLSDLATEMP